MNVLFILNDAPSEAGRSMNALRLACTMSMRSSLYVRIFLIGAAVACARKPRGSRGQTEDAAALVAAVISHGGDVRVCEICAEEHPEAGELVEGAAASSLSELSRWVPEADRLLVF